MRAAWNTPCRAPKTSFGKKMFFCESRYAAGEMGEIGEIGVRTAWGAAPQSDRASARATAGSSGSRWGVAGGAHL
eukprot:COSAG01_NODE_246_length_20450_cov_195.166822_7_plen_75_part_00